MNEGLPHARLVNSGSSANLVAVAALTSHLLGERRLRPGDEVITVAHTFAATANAILYTGATPVFVDIDPRSFNIDPTLAEAAITPKTRAILPVHLFGQPADMAAIEGICQRHGLILIEDCAQSFGAACGSRMTGTIGALGCFSFFPSKNLGCYGDGGMVTTNSAELAEQVRVLRNHGSKVRYHHSVIGYNSRLDEIQAVILRAKLKHITTYNEERRRVAHRYSAQLAGTGITPPYEDGKGVHVYHQYTVLTDSRDAIMAALSAQQIASAIYYPIPLHRQEVFAAGYADVSLPVTEAVAASCMSLPIFPEMTDAQVDEVVRVIKSAL